MWLRKGATVSQHQSLTILTSADTCFPLLVRVLDSGAWDALFQSSSLSPESCVVTCVSLVQVGREPMPFSVPSIL